jgi:CHAD domain-containing protein
LIRTLRKVRRQLGNCRNIDVNIDLITQGLNEASEPSTREAWEQFRSYLQEAREGEIRRARKKLSPYKVAEFVALSHACFDRVRPQLESGNHHARLDDSLQQARRRWTETLAVTKTNRSPDQLHALRIAAKNLRYRAELLAEFQDAPAKALVKKMKKLQQGLGSWHDRHVLFQSVAEFIGRPDFLLSHPETARSLLNEMARERNRETAAVEEILKQAEKI